MEQSQMISFFSPLISLGQFKVGTLALKDMEEELRAFGVVWAP